jgi:membrane protease YdiL (CAAX protease family)
MNKQIWQFFILTFLFSWLLWLPGILMTYNWIPKNEVLITINNVLVWVAGVGPSLVAVYLLYRNDGITGIKKVLGRIFKLNLGYWICPIIFLIPTTLIVAHLLNIILFESSFPQSGVLNEPWWIPVLFIVFFIFQFGEEIGWRGFALDRLQRSMNALFSSILLGSLWALWHLPMFFINGFGHHDYHLPFGQFLLTLILMSIIITWLQNNTKNSLFAAFLIHTYINLSGEVLPLIDRSTEKQGDYTVWIITNILLFSIVVLILSFWGYKKLIRQKRAI